ncbi:maleylpyruvate isomerase N-terminal domain-containing protein [Actinotalea sp. K2]|uniref:maleylpyruvate isomerase N-terminal domain-containing protein n=1 Tax=Actinotalea sp. K2 TaxID=2939438 RepID=UPI0020178036|nr:maleylpyruvate isomerase N-terminal domain-containing protein [Actinotalea sp. K2]MCL3861441.1 maleylpyruvate isomerase N-terminal domain-containing protein [Actinotalea sp. K2]
MTTSALGGMNEVATAEHHLRAQWLRLRSWIGGLDHDATQSPSVLGGWTVADLVAHVGRAMDTLGAAQPTAPGTVPLTLAEYLGTYPGRSQEVAELTRDLAREIADHPLEAVDRMADRALAQLAVLRGLAPDPVVQARRGPVLLSTMVASRVLELVLHADDLARSTTQVPASPGQDPLDPAAVQFVADLLLEIVVDRGGWSLEVVDPLAWVRLAGGRVELTVDTLSQSLQTRYTSDSLPDLGTVLPLL